MRQTTRQPNPPLGFQRLARASAATLISVAQLGRVFADDGAIDFNQDIQPSLVKNCVACHNEQTSDGGLNLESFTGLTTGGDSGAVLDTSAPANSLLLERITDNEDPMPPEDNKVGADRLSAEVIGRLRQWLEDGATPPSMEDAASGAKSASVIQWSRLPENVNPIYALAESADGNILAYGSGNAVYVHPFANGNLLSLRDPTLKQPSADTTKQPASRQAHLDLVQSIAIRPDGQQIASGGFGVVKLWTRDSDHQNLLGPLDRDIRLAAFSPDSEYIACATGESTIEIIDIAAGTIKTYLKLHSGKVTAIAWAIDGQSIVTCDDVGSTVLTHTRIGESAELIGQAAFQIAQVVCIDDKSYLLRSTDGSLHQVRTLANNPPSIELVAGCENISRIWRSARTPKQLFVTCNDGELATLSLDTVKKAKIRTLPAGSLLCARSDDGNRIVSVDSNGRVSLWSKDSDEPIASLDTSYHDSQSIRNARVNSERQAAIVQLFEKRLEAIKKVNEAEIAAVAKAKPLVDSARATAEKQHMAVAEVESQLAMATSALSKLVASLKAQAADTDSDGDSANLEAAKKLVETQKTALGAAKKKRDADTAELKRTEAVLANTNRGAAVAKEKLLDSERKLEGAKQELAQLQTTAESLKSAASATSPLADVCFSLDSSVIILANKSGTLDTFAADDGRPLSSADLQRPISGACVVANRLLVLTSGESASVESLRITPRWQLAKSIQLDRNRSPSRVTALAYSPSGDHLVLGGGPASRFGDLKILDAHSGEIQRDFDRIAEDSILTAAYSPDGRQLLTGGADRLCRLYDVATGHLMRTFEGHSHHVLSIAWRADGASFASGSADGTIKIWNAETGEQFRTITSTQEVASVRFVGSSGQLVSCSADGTCRLHNADDGKTIRQFSGASDALYSLSVSPDERLLSVAGQSGSIWRWELSSGKASPLEKAMIED